MSVTKEQIIERLETIIDPEVSFDIWTMGLIREIDSIGETHVHFVITYTTPLCPAGAIIQQQITDEMHDLGFQSVEIEVSFDPPWEMPEAIKTMLGR